MKLAGKANDGKNVNDTHGNCRQSKWRKKIWPKNIDTHGNCRQGKWRKWIKTNGNWHPSNNQERNLQVMISFICQYLQIPYLLAMCHLNRHPSHISLKLIISAKFQKFSKTQQIQEVFEKKSSLISTEKTFSKFLISLCKVKSFFFHFLFLSFFFICQVKDFFVFLKVSSFF